MELTSNTLAHKDFSVEIKFKDSYLPSLDNEQRYWLQYKALREFGCNLERLNELDYTSKEIRPSITENINEAKATYDESQLIISEQEVMQSWEAPLMSSMADKVTARGGDILEIGFGMGFSATRIIENGVDSYTVVECNQEVISEFYKWKKKFPEQNIKLVEGRWQDVIHQLGEFDGIFFDTYPLNEEEWLNDALNSVSFAETFFPVASKHLKSGGIFTYYTGEINSISNEHQRLLLSYFSELNISVQSGLTPPSNCQYWWNDTMAIVAAYKKDKQ